MAAAVFAVLTGYVSLRATGVYYIMSTLAFGQMLYFLFVSLSPLGGDDGYTLSSRSLLFGEPRLTSDFAFYYLCLTVLALAYLLLVRIAGSRFGRVLNAIRQNPLRAAGAWLSTLPVPARCLRDRRSDRSGRWNAARQPERVRRAGLHVLAAVGRTPGDDDPRRRRLAVGRRTRRDHLSHASKRRFRSGPTRRM